MLTMHSTKFTDLLITDTLLDTKNKRCLNDPLNQCFSSVHTNETLYFLYIFCIFFLQANLRRLDFTGNLIEDIEDGTFSKLSLLEELTLAENQLLKLPVLPPKLTLFNAKYNKIKSRGIKANTFKVSILYYDQTQYQFYTTNDNMRKEKLCSKILFYILK